MTFKNLKPEMATLTKVDDVTYRLDYGDIKYGSDSDLKLEIETEAQKLSVKVSCGGCTKASIKDNVLHINYDTKLLGRILKHVYLFEDDKKIDIRLIGKVV